MIANGLPVEKSVKINNTYPFLKKKFCRKNANLANYGTFVIMVCNCCVHNIHVHVDMIGTLLGLVIKFPDTFVCRDD